MDAAKLERAAQLENEAQQLRREAFAERPLPDHWRVGQRIRYIRHKEHCCDAGEVGTVVAVGAECAEKAAGEYQVFWTRPDSWAGALGGSSQFWTTPDDVELLPSDSDGVGQSDGRAALDLPET